MRPEERCLQYLGQSFSERFVASRFLQGKMGSENKYR
jgi:hypothetical protein